MAAGLVNGELLVTAISELQAPPSSFHLKAVQPHGCGAVVPQLNVPLGPTSRLAFVEAVTAGGPPAIAIPCGCKPPRFSPPKPAPMAGDPGKSCAASRTWATVALVGAVVPNENRLSLGSIT